MRRLKPEQRVTYEEAKVRALACLRENPRSPKIASWVGMHIWPKNELKAQGLGGAATRILKKMESEGLVRWTRLQMGTLESWGWVAMKREG